MSTHPEDHIDPTITPPNRQVAAINARSIGLLATGRSILRSVPTLFVLIALAGIAYWGRLNDWRAPKFTSLFGLPPQSKPEDWCAEHNVPDSRCIKCHPELVGDSAQDWCKEHGVPESRCTTCHPEILTKGVASDWCKEHGVPETNCTICHPEIAVKGELSKSDVVVEAAGTDGVQLPPHTLPAATENMRSANDPARTSESASASAKPTKDPAKCQTHMLRVQFASAESVKKAGVRLESVVERPMEQVISANGETQYDRTRLAQVASRLPGLVWRVEKEIGETVHKGEVLALVDAVEVGRAKAELLTAAAQRELRAQSARRIEGLLPRKISTEAQFDEAQAALREAEIRVYNARQGLMNLGLSAPPESKPIPNERELQFLGLPEAIRAALETETPSANLLPLVASLDGVVIQRQVVAGEIVEASKPLFAIADTRRLWLTIDVPLSQASRVAIGQSVRFRPERGNDTAYGTIAWISTTVDEQTRMVKVRADLDNSDGRLLAATFGRAQITIRASPNATAVPNEAIQWEGCCHVVFVRLTDDIFQTRKVRLGSRDSEYTEVLVGVLPGEVVVTGGSHVLKSEILKSNLGAGCCVE